MAGRDTKTRYQGVYARHAEGCRLSVAWVTERRKLDIKLCDCTPRYFGVAWDPKAHRNAKTANPTYHAKAVEARNARADLQASLRHGRPVGTSAMRLRAAVDQFKEAVDDGTALNKHGRPYREDAAKDLKGTLGHFPDDWYGRLLDNITGGDVQHAIDEWLGASPPLSGSRIRSRVYALQSLYRWGRQRGYTAVDPGAEVQLPALDSTPRDRVATPGEMVLLLAALPEADQVPLAIAAYTSARGAEVKKLDWLDVDLDARLMILAAGGGKSEAATRPVPIVRPLLVILKAAHLRQGRPKSGKVCPPLRASKSGQMATGPYLRRCREAWDLANAEEKKAAKKEGRPAVRLAPINLQEARHTCATWLDHAGVSPKVASEWMGHSTPTRQAGAAPITLNRYTHMLPGELERACEQVDAFLAERAAAAAEKLG